MKKELMLFVVACGMTAAANAQWSGTNPLTTNSKVGIGVSSPSAKLDILSSSAGASGPSLSVAMTQGALLPGGPNYSNPFEVKNTWMTGMTPTTYLDFAVSGNGTVSVRNKLRIGATAASGTYANYALSVDGRIIAKECVIQVSNWADYVFKKDYKLLPLQEVEQFINDNKHLPDIPSEKDVHNNGVGLGEMNKLLLQKIEELTLYVIEQDKRIKELETKSGK